MKARLPQWYKVLQSWTADSNQTSLLTAILGELANNCFDHNLGQWVDRPGCLVGLSNQQNLIQIVVADRGQGIVSSLGKQLPAGTADGEVMSAAFEKRISGRAPEQRGNGLKFVVEAMAERNRLFCFSGNTTYRKGAFAFNFDLKALAKAPGTLSAIEWGLP